MAFAPELVPAGVVAALDLANPLAFPEELGGAQGLADRDLDGVELVVAGHLLDQLPAALLVEDHEVPQQIEEAALLEDLPAPRHFYALDGTVSLVRSRFLHLHVDLQQREAIYDAAPQQPVLLPRGMRTMPPATPGPDAEDPAAQPVPSAFLVFDMEQNRQVKTGQVEYFDGPVLSVLAYITAIEPEPGDD